MPLSRSTGQTLLYFLHFPLHDFLQSCSLLFLPLWLIIIQISAFFRYLALFFSSLLIILMRFGNDAHEDLLFTKVQFSSDNSLHNPKNSLIFAL